MFALDRLPDAARHQHAVVVLVHAPLGAWSAAAEKSILVVGDSLSAAYGIPRNRGWVALLEERLKREHPDYIVVNASISGETSSGGRARLAKLLERHRPAIVVLELGANDGLRGLPVAQLRTNLSAMIRDAQESRARVVLVGMKMPPNYGEDYARLSRACSATSPKRTRRRSCPSSWQISRKSPSSCPTASTRPPKRSRSCSSASGGRSQPLLK